MLDADVRGVGLPRVYKNHAVTISGRRDERRQTHIPFSPSNRCLSRFSSLGRNSESHGVGHGTSQSRARLSAREIAGRMAEPGRDFPGGGQFSKVIDRRRLDGFARTHQRRVTPTERFSPVGFTRPVESSVLLCDDCDKVSTGRLKTRHHREGGKGGCDRSEEEGWSPENVFARARARARI